MDMANVRTVLVVVSTATAILSAVCAWLGWRSGNRTSEADRARTRRAAIYNATHGSYRDGYRKGYDDCLEIEGITREADRWR